MHYRHLAATVFIFSCILLILARSEPNIERPHPALLSHASAHAGAALSADPEFAVDSEEARQRAIQAAHVRALGFAQARERIAKLPELSNWRLPPTYAAKLHGSSAKPTRTPGHAPNIWFPIGPQPIAADPSAVWGVKNAHETGRIISIAPTPQGDLYAGSEFGGLWHYSISSKRWTPLTDDQVSPQISAITLDPAHPGTIYAATGEDNSLAPCGLAVQDQGILKSTDGAKWEVLGASSLAGAGIARIFIGQSDNSAILAATSAGIFRSADGGNSWTSTYSGCVWDMVESPSPAATFYAAGPGGFMRSTNGGLAWDSSDVGQPPLPSGFKMTYAALGISRGRARSDVLYASINGSGKWAAYMSRDAGNTWTNIGVPKNLGSGFSSVGGANTLATDPQNSNIAAFGGDWLFIYNAGSKSWNQVNVSAVAHSDTRALAFDSVGHLFIGNDGGVWELPNPSNVNSGISFNDGGLQVTEFYHGFGVSSDGALLIAGSQDNGVEIYNGNLRWASPIGADGSSSTIDQNDSAHQFAQSLDPPGLQEKTRNSGWSNRNLPNGFALRGGFPMAIAPAPPGLESSPTSLYVGSNGVYKLSYPRSGGQPAWSALDKACPKPSSPGCAVSVVFLYVDPVKANRVFAAWSDGTVNFSTNSGAAWKNATVAPLKGGISAIAASPDDLNTIAVTTGPGHVWVGSKINTSSPIWTDVTGDLPVVAGIRLNAVIYSSRGLIVASEGGVFGQDGGTGSPWLVVGRGLPNTRIMDLQWKLEDLVAITYGRGAWEISSSAAGH